MKRPRAIGIESNESNQASDIAPSSNPRLPTSTLSLNITDRSDHFAPIKKSDFARYILLASPANVLLLCTGFVLTREICQIWFGKESTHPVSIEPFRSNRLRICRFDIGDPKDEELIKTSLVRRATRHEKFVNGDPVATHPIVESFTNVPEERATMMKLIHQVVKVFNIKEYPVFSRNDAGSILCRFQIDDNFIMVAELRSFEAAGYRRYDVFAKKNSLFIQFELRC